MKQPLSSHPRRQYLRLLLTRHPLLSCLEDAEITELAELLVMQDVHRGECLLVQGSDEPRQFFVLEGLLKRTVSSPQGREMTLRFAGEGDFETCYDAWRRHEPVAYAVVCAGSGCVASLSMGEWSAFLARHPAAQQAFTDRVVALGQTLVDHAVGLLLLDAKARVDAFSRRQPDLLGRLVQKDLASHLNLSAETLCRLSRRADACLAKAAA